MRQVTLLFICTVWLLLATQHSVTAQDGDAPQLALQAGHVGHVNSLACSPDGRLLAVGGTREVRLHDIESGTLVRRFTGIKEDVYSLDFSPDGRFLVSGGGQVLIWDVASGRLSRSLDVAQWDFRVASFWPDGNTVATCGRQGGVQLWDVATATVKRTLLAGKILRPIAFSPDGKTIVGRKISSGNWRKAHSGMWTFDDLAVWNATTEQELGAWTQKGYTQGLAFSPDGSVVAVTNNSALHVRKIPTGEILWKAPAVTARAVAFSRDGKSVVAGGDRNEVRVWEAASGRLVQNLTAPYSHAEQVAVSQNAIVTSPTVRIWDAQTGRLKQSVFSGMAPVFAAFMGHSRDILSLSAKVQVLNQDLTVQQDVRQVDAALVVISPDGKWAVSNTPAWYGDSSQRETPEQGTFTLRDTKEWKPVRSLLGLSGPMCIAWSPDGESIAASSVTEAVVRVWSVSGWKHYQSLGFFKGAYDLAFSPDGKSLAACVFHKGYVVRLWDVASSRLKAEFRHPNALNLAFAPDGKTLATANQSGNVRLWNCATGRMIWETNAHDGEIKQLAFSPDGRILASGGSDGAIQFLQPRDGKILRTLAAHTANVNSLSFSRDSHLLVSGGADGALHIWDVAQGKLLVTRIVLHRAFPAAPVWIAFTPQGYYDGALGIETFIRWRVGDKLLLAEQFAARFRQPLMIRKALSDVPSKEARKK